MFSPPGMTLDWCFYSHEHSNSLGHRSGSHMFTLLALKLEWFTYVQGWAINRNLPRGKLNILDFIPWLFGRWLTPLSTLWWHTRGVEV